MTKKLLLKLNMAIVFVVVLFAGIVFADEKVETLDQLISFVQNNFDNLYFDGTSGITSYKGTNEKLSRVMVKFDEQTIRKFNNANVNIYYIDANNTTTIVARIGHEGPSVEIMSTASDQRFSQVSTIDDVITSSEKSLREQVIDIYKYNDYSGFEDGVELTFDDSLKGKSYIFALNNGTSSLSKTTMKYVADNGEATTTDLEDISGNIELQPDVDIWYATGSKSFVDLSTKNLENINQKKRYYFSVSNQGTYKVILNIDGEEKLYTNGIRYRDSMTGVGNQAVFGGAYESLDSNEVSANNVVLAEGDIYYWDFDINSNVTITYQYLHSGTTNPNEDSPSSNLKGVGAFEVIEKIFSDFILSIARVLNWIVAMSMGENVTIDTIVFNEYPDAKLEFFKTDIYGNNVETSSNLVSSLREPVSIMYGLFRNLAIIGYLVILVYIGIKIMLSSTTAQKKAGYKETFLAWVTGLIILFFMPYYMKYTIALNDAIVKYVKGIPSIEELESNVHHAPIDTNKGFVYTNFENAIGEGNDYMSLVYDIANHSGRLGYSIAYLVMSWQVIMLVVYYYKRAFIVALLIIIFPLIAFSYVWDKLNDGKSQALSSWIREFTISVMVQAFHATVFAFVVATIYSSMLGTTNSRGISNPDFILLIIAAKFLFEGEQILKQIFGGGGEVLGTAAQTGMRVAAITRLTTGVAGRVIHNTVGKEGLVRTGWRSWQGVRRDNLLLKKTPDGGSVFDMLASSPSRDRRKNELLPSEGAVTPNIDKTAEMINRLNNMNKNSDAENAQALKMYRELLDARNGTGPNAMTPEEAKQFDAMMRKCNLTKEQLDKINEASIAATAAFVALGNNPTKEQTKEILQKLRLEIEAILPRQIDRNGKDYSGKKNLMADLMMEATLINMKEGVSSSRNPGDPESYFNDIYNSFKELSDKTHFVDSKNMSKLANTGYRRKKRAENIYRQYCKANSSLSKAEKLKVRTVAYSLVTLEQATSGDTKDVVSMRQASEALQTIKNNRILAESMKKYTRITEDADTLKYVLYKKIGEANENVEDIDVRRAIDSRSRALVDLYRTKRPEATGDEITDAKRVARKVAYAEFVGTGIRSDVVGYQELRNQINSLESEGDKELVGKMMELSSIQGSIDDLKHQLSLRVRHASTYSHSITDERFLATIDGRTQKIVEEFKNENESATDDEIAEANRIARTISYAEFINTSSISSVVSYATLQAHLDDLEYEISKNTEFLGKLLKHSTIGYDLSNLRNTLNRRLSEGRIDRVNRRSNRTIEEIESRINVLTDGYKSSHSSATEDEIKNVTRLARKITFAESFAQNNDRSVVDYEVLDTQLSELLSYPDRDMVNSLMALSTIDVGIDSLRTKIAEVINDRMSGEFVKEWARSNSEKMEDEAYNRAQAIETGVAEETDPYSTILNIIEAAQRGSGGNKRVSSLDMELFERAVNSSKQNIIERKENVIENFNSKAKELGDVGLRLEGYEYRKMGDFTPVSTEDNRWTSNNAQITRNIASNIKRAVQKNILEEKRDVEQPTFEGYTLDEIRNRRNDEAWSVVNSALGIVSDVSIAPMTTLAGAAIGAAFTDDGMPIEESFTGAMSGLRVGTFASDKVVHKLTGEDRRAEERSQIQKKINKRINDEQKARLKEQMAAEEANEDARRLDNSLVISGANAHLHIESDGTVSATINIRASNAEYISVDETPVIPSGGWAAYQESFYYVFKNQNPKASHNLYIYVRDRNGNVKGVRIEGIHQ